MQSTGRGTRKDAVTAVRPSKRVLMLGRPGAGKGTQARRLSEALDVVHISTGELLRDAIVRDGPVGRRCLSYVAEGRLVPTLLMANLVRDSLFKGGAIDDGFVLDGFPRTCDQLRILDEMLGHRELAAALELDVSQSVALQRLVARCRADDEPDIGVRRLREFDDYTRPMISRLDGRGLLISIDGSREEDDVTADVVASVMSAAPAARRLTSV
jgi:adenylate kinase